MSISHSAAGVMARSSRTAFGDGAIGFVQHPAVVAQPPGKPPAGPGPCRYVLCGREAFGMLLEALDAEEFAADRFFRLLRENRCRRSERAKD